MGPQAQAVAPAIMQAQVSAAAAEFMKDTPMYQLYQRVAPRPEDFPRLLDKIGQSMATDFGYTEEVRSLRVPTLIVCADADIAAKYPAKVRPLVAASANIRPNPVGSHSQWSRASAW